MCSTNLVLCAHSLSKQFLLYVNSISGKCILITEVAFECIQALEKSHRKCRTRTQARSSRQVSDVMNLNSIFDSQQLQTRTHRGMLNLMVAAYVFDFRI